MRRKYAPPVIETEHATVERCRQGYRVIFNDGATTVCRSIACARAPAERGPQ